MADQYAAIDPNKFHALLAHSGTSDTAETRRVVVTSDGALSVSPVGGTTTISGTIPVNVISGLGLGAYDYVAVTYPSGTTETYVFYSGGTAGTNKGTVSLTYLDTNKGSISIVQKTGP